MIRRKEATSPLLILPYITFCFFGAVGYPFQGLPPAPDTDKSSPPLTPLTSLLTPLTVVSDVRGVRGVRDVLASQLTNL